MARVYRSRFGFLLIAALLVFVPLGMLEAWTAEFSHVEGSLSAAELGGVLTAALATLFASLLGEVFYAGVVAAEVIEGDRAKPRPVVSTLRSLPTLRLIAADLTYALIVIGGVMLLIVPGFVFLVWFALVAPAVEVEHRRVGSALRRSRELVRQDFWQVAAFIFPLVIASDLLSELVFSETIALFGESFVGESLGHALAEVLVAPFLALAVTVLFVELRGAAEQQV